MKLLLLFIICALVACVPALYKPSAEHAERSGRKLDDLKQGRQLYIDHCGSCHQLYLPRQFDPVTWKKSVHSMETRAKIDTNQRQLILWYLTSE